MYELRMLAFTFALVLLFAGGTGHLTVLLVW